VAFVIGGIALATIPLHALRRSPSPTPL